MDKYNNILILLLEVQNSFIGDKGSIFITIKNSEITGRAAEE